MHSVLCFFFLLTIMSKIYLYYYSICISLIFFCYDVFHAMTIVQCVTHSNEDRCAGSFQYLTIPNSNLLPDFILEFKCIPCSWSLALIAL